MKEGKNNCTIECDLLLELIEIAQYWLDQNGWRRGTTPRNDKMMEDAVRVISECRKNLM
jgi:hypothetical protein